VRQGKARICAYGITCRPRANVTKRAGLLLRRREIGGLQALLPTWSAMPTNLIDRQRVGRCVRDQVCEFQER
jgi:hypothetical protein